MSEQFDLNDDIDAVIHLHRETLDIIEDLYNGEISYDDAVKKINYINLQANDAKLPFKFDTAWIYQKVDQIMTANDSSSEEEEIYEESDSYNENLDDDPEADYK